MCQSLVCNLKHASIILNKTLGGHMHVHSKNCPEPYFQKYQVQLIKYGTARNNFGNGVELKPKNGLEQLEVPLHQLEPLGGFYFRNCMIWTAIGCLSVVNLYSSPQTASISLSPLWLPPFHELSPLSAELWSLPSQ